MVMGASFHEPHKHQGKVEPFPPGDPNVPLDDAALKILKEGKPYKTQIRTGVSGRGLCVQDVDASADVIWGRILDYNHYSKMVPSTLDSELYAEETHKPTKQNQFLEKSIYARLKIGVSFVKLEFYCKHSYHPSLNSLTWTLDYTKKSDLDDSVGYWYVLPLDEGHSRVFYSVSMSVFDWVPSFVVDILSTKALTDATGWVKKYSELEMLNHKPITNTASASASSPNKKKSASSSSTSPPCKKHAWQFWLKPCPSKETLLLSDNSTTCEEEEEGATTTTKASSTSKPLPLSTLGWERYGLVGLILLLALYNLYLFFSQ
eukprot:CAMPEP_0118701862 /NCGR_PEP_ID=MMETSP0800-20121206/17519_1 /TAXON_ID=210618 ORGANISM="Striatella unipunctata, Strain CCMP2910" /NCGR_SAMPLE_ID=MMETSP0800 /ASSEMBLY_ACC=CAM_ASM_000638 /LENGTH=317 /DNA_ID=CAMNT_0006602895 /DNA_START=332 /DNA_END=1285 /DNA_ORIENTATION=+